MTVTADSPKCAASLQPSERLVPLCYPRDQRTLDDAPSLEISLTTGSATGECMSTHDTWEGRVLRASLGLTINARAPEVLYKNSIPWEEERHRTIRSVSGPLVAERVVCVQRKMTCGQQVGQQRKKSCTSYGHLSPGRWVKTPLCSGLREVGAGIEHAGEARSQVTSPANTGLVLQGA
jgi:hypothetical protein